MKAWRGAAIVAACLGVAVGVGRGQEAPPGGQDLGTAAVVVVQQSATPTAIDKALATRGSLIVRGFSDVGTMQADDNASIDVTAVEISGPGLPQSATGLAVTIRSRAGRAVLSHVDYSEIDTLVSSIQALEHLDATSTRLNSYEARIRSRSDLEIANYADANGGRMASVRGVQVSAETGQVAYAGAYFPASRLSELRQLISNAKQTLDRATASK